MKIKDVAKITGLSKRTLQYYDEIDLMQTERSVLNYRIYSDADLEWLWKIQVYKEMGFQLNEIRSLLKATDDEQKRRLLEKQRSVEVEVAALERKWKFIEKIIVYGIPDRSTIKSEQGMMTYRELVKELAEKEE